MVVIRFAEPSKAYEALSVLKQCDAKVASCSQPPAWWNTRPKANCTSAKRVNVGSWARERLPDRDVSACSAARSVSCSARARAPS